MDHRPVSSTPFQTARSWLKRRLGHFMVEEPPAAAYRRGVLPPSLAQMQGMVEAHKLATLLPYESYDEDHDLYWNSDGLAFALEASPATGIDAARLNVLSGLLSQGLKADTTIQITLWADPDIHDQLDAWKRARHGRSVVDQLMIDTLAQKRVEYMSQGNYGSFFRDQPFLLRNWRLFISVTRPADPRFPDPSEIEFLERTRDSFIGILQSARMEAQQLKPDALIRLIDGIINPHPAPREPQRWDPNQLLADQMVDADTLCLVGRDSLSLVHKDYPVTVLGYSVRQYPLQWPGWEMGELCGALMDNTLRLPCPVLYTQLILVTDQINSQSDAKMKSMRATQMVDTPVGKFVPAWKDRKGDWDFVMNSLGEGHKLFKSYFGIAAFAPQGNEEYIDQRVRAVFGAKSWKLERNRFSVLPDFLSTLPMMATPNHVALVKRLGRLATRLSWNDINCAPVLAEWRGTGTPLLQLVGRRGQLMTFDPFDNTKGNFNIAMAATSGAGKSFATQELILSILGTGGRVWTMDAGDSYLNICTLFGGQYIKFSKEQRPNINPFTHVNADEFDEEELPMLKQMISQMASPAEELNSSELAYLEQGIQQAWSRYMNDATVTAVASTLAAMQSDVARGVALKMYSYTAQGAYGRLFEGRANIDVSSSPFCVLELDDLSSRPDLQAVVLFSMMMRIAEEMYRSNRSQRKFCIIDEAWQLMGTGRAGKFIERGYRTARKYGGAFMSVTQNIDDYYKSENATAALNSADWLLLLRQKPEALAAAIASERLVADESLKQLLSSVDTIQGKYSEIAIKGPSGTSVGRLLVDPYSEKLFSTKDREFQFLRDSQKAGVPLADAIQQLVLQSQTR